MNCLVINATSVRGCSYKLKAIFLDELKADQVKEVYLLQDGPGFCVGCKTCFNVGEEMCPHWDKTAPIVEALVDADLVLFVFPVYVMRVPGQLKTFLDHLGVYWFAHRPKEEFFGKQAAIISQSIGAPNGPAQKDVKTSLSWMGFAKPKSISFGLMEGVIWEEISEARRNKMEEKTRAFARGLKNIQRGNMSLKSKIFFNLGKMVQKSQLKEGKKSKDLDYWISKGWIRSE